MENYYFDNRVKMAKGHLAVNAPETTQSHELRRSLRRHFLNLDGDKV